jgi:hypothetical protein
MCELVHNVFRRRLLLSQNRHEVSISVGLFDDDYVGYLYQKHQKETFLIMETHGPFRVDDQSHVKHLGRLLLGFTLAENEVKTVIR